jgi:hypothetical protein
MKLDFQVMIEGGRLCVVAHDQDEGDFSPAVMVTLKYPVTSDSLFRAQMMAKNYLVSTVRSLDAHCPNCGAELVFVNIYELRPGEYSHDYACGSTRVFVGNGNEAHLISPECQEAEAIQTLDELADANRQIEGLEEEIKAMRQMLPPPPLAYSGRSQDCLNLHEAKAIQKRIMEAMGLRAALADPVDMVIPVAKEVTADEMMDNPSGYLPLMQAKAEPPRRCPVHPLFNSFTAAKVTEERPKFALINGGKAQIEEEPFRPEEPQTS